MTPPAGLLIAAFGFCSLSAPAAGGELAGPVKASVVRIVDGDTLAVRAQIWVDQEIDVKVRLADADAPELYRPRCEAEKAPARAARDRLRVLAGQEVQLADIRHDKYAGRVAARVLTLDGVDVGGVLIEDGLAIPQGGAKPWCVAG